MERVKRNERIGAMARILTGAPNRTHTLSYFAEMFGAAKSTISEDLSILSNTFKNFDLGELITIPGAAGGVIYRPIHSRARTIESIEAISKRLSEKGRLLPGDFLYTTDVTCDPTCAEVMGEVLARRYYDMAPDFILTMETKGIPVAMATSRMLNVPLVIARKDSRAYEGPAIKLNYTTGNSASSMETMALARRAVKSGQRALIIDDFMKGGGTLRGMHDLMEQFEVTVIGTGVVIATAEPQNKRVKNVTALMVLRSVDRENNSAVVTPSDWLLSKEW